MPQSSLVQEGLMKERSHKFGQNFRSNAACDKDAPGGLKFQGQVPGLGAVHRNENIECLFAKFALASHAGMRDDSGRIGLLHVFAKPRRRLSTTRNPTKNKKKHKTTPTRARQ